MKTASGNPAELEISLIGERLEFRIYADQRLTILQVVGHTEVLTEIRELDEIVRRITAGCQGYWQIPARRGR